MHIKSKVVSLFSVSFIYMIQLNHCHVSLFMLLICPVFGVALLGCTSGFNEQLCTIINLGLKQTDLVSSLF